jgi:hypothetical protein
VRSLQDALLSDPIAPAAVIPLLNLTPDDPNWQYWQRYYLKQPEAYPVYGKCPLQRSERSSHTSVHANAAASTRQTVSGFLQRTGEQDYTMQVMEPITLKDLTISLVTLDPTINEQLMVEPLEQSLTVSGRLNRAGNWFLVQAIESLGNS